MNKPLARNDMEWHTYIFHVVLFSAVAPKGRKFSRSCKEKFFCKKSAVVKNVSPCGRVMSPLGRVMSPFGRAMSRFQNHILEIIWKISKNAVPQKKGCSFGKPIFRVKGRNLAPFWRCRYVGLHFIVKLINDIIMITGYGFHSHVDGTMAGIVSITRVSIHLLRSYYIHVSSFIIIYHHWSSFIIIYHHLSSWSSRRSATSWCALAGAAKVRTAAILNRSWSIHRTGEIGWNRFWKRRLFVYIDESYIYTL